MFTSRAFRIRRMNVCQSHVRFGSLADISKLKIVNLQRQTKLQGRPLLAASFLKARDH